MLPRRVLETDMGLDQEPHLMLFEPCGERVPFVHFQHYAAVRYRHAVTVHWVEVGIDLSLFAKSGIEMANQLMAVEIEIDPRDIAATFGAPYYLAIETSGFRDISDLNGDMKRCEWHDNSLEKTAIILPESRICFLLD